MSDCSGLQLASHSDSDSGGEYVKNNRRTPTQSRARLTVETILEATARVLVEDGYARLSTNRVARRAGVSIGTLYQYFADKDELVAALAERVAKAQVDAFVADLQQIDDQPLDDAVHTLVRGIISAKRVQPELAHALAATQVPRLGGAHAEQHVLARLVDTVAATLRNRPDVRTIDAGLASYALVHAINGVIQQTIAHRPRLLSDDALADVLVELCVCYLRPDPS